MKATEVRAGCLFRTPCSRCGEPPTSASRRRAGRDRGRLPGHQPADASGQPDPARRDGLRRRTASLTAPDGSCRGCLRRGCRCQWRPRRLVLNAMASSAARKSRLPRAPASYFQLRVELTVRSSVATTLINYVHCMPHGRRISVFMCVFIPFFAFADRCRGKLKEYNESRKPRGVALGTCEVAPYAGLVVIVYEVEVRFCWWFRGEFFTLHYFFDSILSPLLIRFLKSVFSRRSAACRDRLRLGTCRRSYSSLFGGCRMLHPVRIKSYLTGGVLLLAPCDIR
ncbi:hypothetical protein FRACA_4270003 [Frankia canadensis]|uniref:Uncharacterized protein n=1 Tax=Frankia canadensis TaxID=1836972 RepID=A0A2I2KX66_9ACTN|nr:hypothetical protein FRACA_4270003 [Frankia canadensis]SOU57539.1 hypothetical protein FRACA_4270003 [Frankia canadensis]